MTVPLLVSWMRDVIPPKYVAAGSLTAGAGMVAVVLVCFKESIEHPSGLCTKSAMEKKPTSTLMT
jgi:hypothetical protein